jgi:hypothetical protein
VCGGKDLIDAARARGRAKGINEFLRALPEHVPERGLVIPIPSEPPCAPDPDGPCVLVLERLDVPDELGHREERRPLHLGSIAAADEEGRVPRAGGGYHYEVHFVFQDTRGMRGEVCRDEAQEGSVVALGKSQ